VSTEEGTVDEGVVEVADGSDFVAGGTGDDRGEGGGSESVALLRVEAVEVQELQQSDESRLGLDLQIHSVSVEEEGGEGGGGRTLADATAAATA
jgi:hypothetical protein